MRARQNQVLSILDNYAYRTLVWDIYVERVGKPKRGVTSDEVGIASALPEARKILAAIETICPEGPFLLGNQITLADLHAAPMFWLFAKAEEGRMLLDGSPRLDTWLTLMQSRASMIRTVPS